MGGRKGAGGLDCLTLWGLYLYCTMSAGFEVLGDHCEQNGTLASTFALLCNVVFIEFRVIETKFDINSTHI